MQNSESAKTVAETRIPKAPLTVAIAKTTKLQSPVSETKLPMIKPMPKSSKMQTTAVSPTSTNPTLPLTPPNRGAGVKLRRANSSLADSSITKTSAATSETKLRRIKSTVSETKRPKSQILMTGTKLPKLQQNVSETKSSKIGTMKLPQLEHAGSTPRESKERKNPKLNVETKLPRIQNLNLPLKEINTDVPAVEFCKESLQKSDDLNLSTEQVSIVNPTKTHVTSLPPKVSKKTETDSLKTLVGEAKATHPKVTTGAATKLPKALPGSNPSPKSSKILSTDGETQTLKSPTTPTGVGERKLPKTQLTLTGLKSTKFSESKLHKSPTTPDESKLPRALGAGAGSSAATENRRQRPAIRR